MIGMTKASVAMDRFMDKLNRDGFNKDNQPNNGPELTTAFIEEQLQSFTDLMRSGLVDAATSFKK